MIGKRLAHYEILERIGAGGMGEVYLARDTKLGRNVAVKVLPPTIARDPARLERFEREARALASLNHPNIVTVHSVESDGGVHFLTMELLEGRTLTKVIGRGGLPLGQFLDLATPLADALAAAHAKGITHRDLKPSNVMVDARGILKVLDFGLAKLREEAIRGAEGLSALPTETFEEPLTGEGRVVGTAAYMSPEQAEGKPVDQRSDIFSLGIVLYEMATGVRPFKGDTPVSTISSILRDTPSSVTEVNRVLPRELSRIVMRCLAKEPERRFQTALDVRNELEELKRDVDSGELASAEAPASARRGWSAGWITALAGAAILIAAASWLYHAAGGAWRTESPGALSVKLTRLTQSAGAEYDPALSPDGRMIAYVARGGDDEDIFFRRVDGAKVINLTADSDFDDSEPAFSPDGGKIAFRSERDGGGLFVMGATGESPRRLTTFGHHPAWSPDGTRLVFCLRKVSDPRMGPDTSSIWTVNVETGATRKLFDASAAHPSWSPDGKRIAYWAVEGGQRDIWTARSDGTDRQPVTHDQPTDWHPVWSQDGTYLYFGSDRGGADNIWRIPVSEATGRALGVPEPVTTGTSAVENFSMAGDGRRLAASVYAYQSRLARIGFDPEKEEITGQPVVILDATAGVPEYSPDGKWIAYMSMDGQEDIFVMKADGTGRLQLTNDAFRDRFPRWSPKGDRIAFFSNRSGKYEIWTIRPDGSGLQQVTDVAKKDLIAPMWNMEGTRIYCLMSGKDFGFFDWKEDAAAPKTLENWHQLPPYQVKGMIFVGTTWSPDGSNLLGVVESMQGNTAGLSEFSPETGSYTDLLMLEKPTAEFVLPWWLADGRRLMYMHDNRLVVRDMATGAERVVTKAGGHEGEFTYYFRGADESSLLQVGGTYNEDIWLIDLQSGT